MRSRGIRLGVAAAVLAAAPAMAQPGDPEAGAELFRENCATCHGLSGRGDGPMAGILVVKPANLTELAEDNGGTFPVARVVKRIDGRDPLVSHGSPMPVYGYFWEGFETVLETETGQPIMTSQAIADLIAFLETIQK